LDGIYIVIGTRCRVGRKIAHGLFALKEELFSELVQFSSVSDVENWKWYDVLSPTFFQQLFPKDGLTQRKILKVNATQNGKIIRNNFWLYG
jgi:hypothetical protein